MKHIKKILAIMIMVAMVANCLTAIAIKAEATETGTCGDNIYWELNDWGNLYIYGSGDMPDFSPEEPAPWSYCLPEGQLSVTIEGDVTSVGAYAFYGYTGALFVHMEDSAVMSIGAYAFYGCENLFEIYFPESIFTIGDYAFYNCCNLMEMPRLDLLMSIGNYAFYGCRSLQTFPFGSSLSTIGDYAFCETYNLSTVTFPATLTYLGDSSFGCCYVTTMTFEGPAPQINRWAFNSTFADAYYDPNLDGWSYFPFQDFDSINWYPIGGGESPLLGTGTCGDNLQWELTQDGVMTISGTGRMTDFLAMDLPWQSFTDQITSVVIEEGVEYIGREAFRDCTQISNVTVADSVQCIGANAFDDTAWLNGQPEGLVYIGRVLYTYKGTCPAQVTIPEHTIGIAAMAFRQAETLETINFPSSLREIGGWAFQSCTNLKEIDLNEGLAIIGQVAFGGCNSLTEIVIPDSVTVMESGAFGSCASAEKVVIGDGLTEVSYSAFSYSENLKEIVFGSNLRSIGIGAFRGCTALEQVELPANITVISDSAFRSCTALKNITIPNVTKITYYAFAGCSALEELELPETLQEIGQCAFGYCTSLKSIAIPDNVKTLDIGCFESCTSIEELSVGKGVSSIDSTAFVDCTALKRIDVDPESAYYMSDEAGVLHTKDQKTLLTYPVGRVGPYTVSDTVTKIDRYAFANSVGLTGISLPEGLQTLEYAAFGGCTALTEVRLPDSLTKTWGGTFLACVALETVWFGDGLKALSATMFQDCTALKEVHLSATLETIGGSAFENCTSLTDFTLPDGVKEIQYGAFTNCKNLKNVELSANLEKIDGAAFYKCKSLQEIHIPDLVTGINYNAFHSCDNLAVVTLPKNLKWIDEGAFGYAYALTSIVIPDTVEKINTNAFAGCRNLETVKYTGTQEQWNAISIASGNDYLKNATFQFEFCRHDVVENGICGDCGEEAMAAAVDREGNVVGYYFSLADIGDFAQKIILRKDAAEVADVVLHAGVVLDLNGHTLTVNSILTYATSGVIDSSEKDTGVLVITDTEGNMLSSDNAQLPIYDATAGGYRFFEITVRSVAVTGKTDPKYWFRISVKNFDELHKLIQSGGELNITAKMTWNGGEAVAIADVEFLHQWADAFASNESIYITVSAVNAKDLENFSLTPCVQANGVEICASQL